MGNCNFKKDKTSSDAQTNAISKNLFNLHYIIGKGGFGKVQIKFFTYCIKQVWKVEFKKTKEIYAMKIMSKFRVHQKKSVTSVINEKKLLENLHHTYIIILYFFIIYLL